MKYHDLTLDGISARIHADLNRRLGLNRSILKHSALSILGQVLAGSVYMLLRYSRWALDQQFPDSADEEHLVRLAKIWGVERKIPKFSTGSLLIQGRPGAEIPSGSELARNDGMLYKLTEGVRIPLNTLNVNARVICKTPGKIGNTLPNATLKFISPIRGVSQDECEVLNPGLTQGVDLESIESFRERLIERIRHPLTGGSAKDYEIWAKEKDGVKKVWVYPNRQGAGTFDLEFIMEDPNNPLPSEGEYEEMEALLDKKRPITAQFAVAKLSAKEVNVKIALDPRDKQVEEIIYNRIKEVFLEEANPHSTLPRSMLIKAISDCILKHETFELLEPRVDPSSEESELLVPGSIEFIEKAEGS